MMPSDYRDATFEGLRAGLSRQRGEVYAAWGRHGPGTTRQLAARADLSLLSVRPRTTELFQIGLVCLAEDGEGMPVWDHDGHEGVYRARTAEEWERWRVGMVSGQQVLL